MTAGTLALAALRRAARQVDGALSAAARIPLGLLDDERHHRAMRDPLYAAAHTRRASATTTTIPLDDLRLTLATHDALGPHPWWEAPCGWATSRPATRALDQIRYAQQRLVRGWDERALWSLDAHLAHTLGTQLAVLAENAHGWPDDLYPEFEDWQARLRAASGALLAYAPFDLDPATGERSTTEAQEALRWVADVLPALWD